MWTNTCCSHPLYRETELIYENSLGTYFLIIDVQVGIMQIAVANISLHLAVSGVRNAAQRKLLDELGIHAKDVPVDKFIPLGRILYKAPSDGKWGEHEREFSVMLK